MSGISFFFKGKKQFKIEMFVVDIQIENFFFLSIDRFDDLGPKIVALLKKKSSPFLNNKSVVFFVQYRKFNSVLLMKKLRAPECI